MKKLFALLPALALFAVACTETTTAPVPMAPEVTSLNGGELAITSTPSYTEIWDGRGTDSERCDYVGQPGRPASGWIHWIFSTKGASTSAELTLGGTGSGTYAPGEPLNAEPWHFYTPFFELDGLTAVVNLFGGAAGPGGGLVISDYCPGGGKTLEVEKTAYTRFDREHFWDIAKKVETENGEKLEDGTPKIWLYTDGSGDEKATWTVDVTYEGYKDSGFEVYGEITIENISNPPAAKTITSITDDLGFTGYDDIDVDCGVTFPYDLPAGETLTCTYSVEVDGAVQGDSGTNEVTVVVDGESEPYTATADWEFDEPTTVINETVNIKDISDLFGQVALGTATAPNGATFTYYKHFAFADYGADKCGSFQYDNTASIVETGQEADATLKVNVQCFVYESAWAQGVGGGVTAKPFCDNGFNNWGWTNAITKPYGKAEWPLYAGAAQCDTSKGTLVGHFEVTYNGGFVTKFVPLGGVEFEGEAVYAGSDPFPRLPGRNGAQTTAPGHYSIASSLADAIHVIAHVNVGMPDPNFGPGN